jgi:hypothetical protein
MIEASWVSATLYSMIYLFNIVPINAQRIPHFHYSTNAEPFEKNIRKVGTPNSIMPADSQRHNFIYITNCPIFKNVVILPLI